MAIQLQKRKFASLDHCSFKSRYVSNPWNQNHREFLISTEYYSVPGPKLLEAAKHVLRYLRGTADYGTRITWRYTRDLNRLKLREQESNVMYALSDSDFAGCRDIAKSTSGYVIIMNGYWILLWKLLDITLEDNQLRLCAQLWQRLLH